jgi:class 3 adenylate cyclase
MSQLLTKDLKSIYEYCNNQHEIYQYDRRLDKSLESIERKGLHELKNDKAVIFGVKPEGRILFQASKINHSDFFTDTRVLDEINKKSSKNINDGYTYFTFNNEEYFGIYKYNSKWDIFIFRAEELNDFYKETTRIFRDVSIIIIIITIAIAGIGIFIIRYLLRYIQVITSNIMKMVETQQLSVIDMSKATNDDITYMGLAFNSLSNTVGNLISIFRKFANRDIVIKAYRDREVRLEGTKKDLTILFTDIKRFTFITETLGTDIIRLLNMHYDRAIREIIKYDGVIGSIIGDALLAVYGALEDTHKNKSYQAIQSAYALHRVVDELKSKMTKIRDEIIAEKGTLDETEEAVYRAVLLEIGVGIDGGQVFYGTLGSYLRMTNTVIGDNVNAASRLEGLTRVYNIPIICSEYVKNDIEENVEDAKLHFIEIDTVMVKGKTYGRKIYWPIPYREMDEPLRRQVALFQNALSLYYSGEWKEASIKFQKCKLPPAEEFKQRTSTTCPTNWNGIWQMTTK